MSLINLADPASVYNGLLEEGQTLPDFETFKAQHLDWCRRREEPDYSFTWSEVVLKEEKLTDLTLEKNGRAETLSMLFGGETTTGGVEAEEAGASETTTSAPRREDLEQKGIPEDEAR